MERTTVACPVELALLTTSKWRLARTVPFPANDCAGGFAAYDECLGIHHGTPSQHGRSEQSLVLVDDGSLHCPRNKGGACSSSKKRSASPRVRAILTPSPPDVPFALRTIGNPVRSTQFLRSSALLDDLSGRNANALFVSHVHESRSCTHDRKTFRATKRSLNQDTDRRLALPADFSPARKDGADAES